MKVFSTLSHLLFLVGPLLFASCKKDPSCPTCGEDNKPSFTKPITNARLIPVGNLSLPRYGLTAATANNKIVFAGGPVNCAAVSPGSTCFQASLRVDIYDVLTNRWSAKELPPSGIGRIGMAAAAVGNKILLAGGTDVIGDDATSEVNIYDALSDTWSTAALSEPRYGMGVATLGDKVFFAGGNGPGSGPSKVVDVYNGTTNTWTKASLSEERYGLSATAIGNKIYFAGGWRSSGVASKTIDIYDGLTGSWSTSSLGEGRSYMASIAVGSKLFWAGGLVNSASSSGTAEIKDVGTGVSSFATIRPRSQFTAVRTNDHIVFFTGDYVSDTNGSAIEVYNIATGNWSTVVLDKKVVGAVVIAVGNTIYVAGGWDKTPNQFLSGVWKLEF